MKQIFISYKHSVNPDDWLAKYFYDNLSKYGYSVFIDSKIKIGQCWPTIIKDQINSADFFIILISEDSIKSEMIIEEVSIACDSHRVGGRPVILPIRINYSERLPYDLGAVINRLQYHCWKTEGDEVYILKEFMQALRDQESTKLKQEQITSSELFDTVNEDPVEPMDKMSINTMQFDPAWLNMLKAPGGAEPVSSPFYISRAIDNLAKNLICRQGSTIRINGSFQTGKSSLLARLYNLSRIRNYQVLYLDFQRLHKDHLADLETLLKYIADLVAIKFSTEKAVSYYWESPLGAKDKLTHFIDRELLISSNRQVVLFMDEVDRIFGFETYRNDFFSLIRSWHNNRAIEPHWERLSLVLSYSTGASLFITDLNQSPFNVGDVINLADFNYSQIEELNIRHGSPVNNHEELGSLIELLGGHPFLIRKALYHIVVHECSVQELVRKAMDDDGPFNDHLHRYLLLFSEQPELSIAMRNVIKEHYCQNDLIFYRLRSWGLISGSNCWSVEPRCNLYYNYFQKHL